MRTIVVMFDTLCRRFLPPYGGSAIAPNFTRLAERSVTFDQCYAGSMPCIPARRELHTGRYNFLHRSWGPLEPFDDSLPELLRRHDVYSHLVTDHDHYWEDGGATYHGRFTTFDLVRGQEGDPWIAEVPEDKADYAGHPKRRQDRINRVAMRTADDHPQNRVFDGAEDFLRRNGQRDDWHLHVEAFDPHEPFFALSEFTDLYDLDGPARLEWPPYGPVTETDDVVDEARRAYLALLTMCDRSLGRVLDLMDELALWDDTMLIVCTDHGFLLGEHQWWGKTVQPWYDENIHTPLFVWDPRSRRAGERREALVQTIDLAPTILAAHGIEATPDMQGRALQATISDGTPVRTHGLFGCFGAHVSVTDGRYVYMRAAADHANQPLFEHTLMPTHMRGMFALDALAEAELAPPFSFTKGVRTLRVPATTFQGANSADFGTLLFDLATDPGQHRPLTDPALEQEMIGHLVRLMIDSDAPLSQYDRLGLPRPPADAA